MTSASAAIAAVLDLLELAGVDATRDAAGFDPVPARTLVGLPARVRATLGGETFEVPIYIVSGDPLNTAEAVDRLYAIAETACTAVAEQRYTPTTWAGSGRVGSLPAIEIIATVSVSNDPEEG